MQEVGCMGGLKKARELLEKESESIDCSVLIDCGDGIELSKDTLHVLSNQKVLIEDIISAYPEDVNSLLCGIDLKEIERIKANMHKSRNANW